ncbi:glycosyltransferase family 2 protein [Bailinhaonella thermotolerans]|uniref:Glycosyltransferase n=1 Tax=Bailinhaonella thermotolerans TaxID=1070861 RepID=A0A3A4A5R6_9ACTN|nr:glycosyltransferase family 2 protein [Bailinhaonella thermotolerans]RJL24226.1 glycosyltransferase [Bailinhaonella thermotolerans]
MSAIAPLPEELSARRVLGRGQRDAALLALAALAAAAVVLGVPAVATAGVAVVTAAYTLVVTFKLLLVCVSGRAPVLRFGEADLAAVPEAELPPYTLLVPLYREHKMVPGLVARLAALDYPADRLQVLFLVEEDDQETWIALDDVPKPPGFEVVLVPPEGPRTKPKACNVGLARARGDFCVIYDAEDRPDPDQLRKAVAAFRSLPRWVVCVQAELRYWNPWTNWLTRCFAAEYAYNFGLFLRGLDRFRLPIPLGGTSNHFRADALRDLGGWDPHNVTEDADLGIRIARRGWGVRMMESVTEEEANSRVYNWLRQRSRWIKGYYQTWLVHMRSPWRLWRELGPRGFLAFHLTFGFPTLTTLVNPVFWALTAAYLVVGPDPISPLFPAPVFYVGVLAMLLGNLLVIYSLMLGCLERNLHGAVPAMLLAPAYWALMSLAAIKALCQLARPVKRHYWELTEHGLVTEADARPEPWWRRPILRRREDTGAA